MQVVALKHTGAQELRTHWNREGEHACLSKGPCRQLDAATYGMWIIHHMERITYLLRLQKPVFTERWGHSITDTMRVVTACCSALQLNCDPLTLSMHTSYATLFERHMWHRHSGVDNYYLLIPSFYFIFLIPFTVENWKLDK